MLTSLRSKPSLMKSMPKKKTVVVIAGTRPECIKLCPVIYELKAHAQEFRTLVCNSGQHDEMIDQVFDDFDIDPDINLAVMQPGQSLSGLSAKLFNSIDSVVVGEKPEWVIVQGDTTTTMVAALCCFYNRIKLAHVEAGLRTYDRIAPFPEEINRRIVSLVADFHFAPTEAAKRNLLQEGVTEANVLVTGNTGIDSLLWMRDRIRVQKPLLMPKLQQALFDNRRLVLITGHRRESFGPRFNQICLAIKDIAEFFDDKVFVYPVHLNPKVRKPVNRILGNIEHVLLTDPLPYKQFVYLMDRSEIILTDSGGIQEEAPTLGKPVLVMREITERPEGIEVGASRLVGTRREKIVEAAISILNTPTSHQKRNSAYNPYGDGNAAKRIVKALRQSS